jgi:predicted Zn finger-like uncharacterized protein
VSSTLASFNVQCPSCDASFPVDSGKVPDDGIYAICSQCQRTFLVERPEEAEPACFEAEPADFGTEPADFGAEPAGFGAEPAAAATEGEAETEEEPEGGPPSFEDLRSLAPDAVAESGGVPEGPGGATLSEGMKRFGRRDPQDRAKRLARVLVSDIIAYYPERFQESRSRSTVKEDFEDEVKKSWKEYVDQVGEELARSTPYFTEALNEILAGGEELWDRSEAGAD